MTPGRPEGLRNTASSEEVPVHQQLPHTAWISVFCFAGVSHEMKLENQHAGELQILPLKVNVPRAGDGSVGEALVEQALTT